MLELIRGWLVGVTCAAMIAALAQSLTPAGPIRKIGRLTGGLILLIAVLQPVLALDTTALSQALTDYRRDAEGYAGALEEENYDLMKGIIEEQAGAYILDKAAELGIQCQVSVEAGGEGDWPVPTDVTVTGALTEDQRQALTREIEAGFAIPAERQHYESGETG